MTMHLMSPVFTTTGKKKGKAKHRNAEAAALARRNAEAWQAILEKYDVKPARKVRQPVQSASRFNPVVGAGPVLDPKRDTRHIPSLDTGQGLAAKRENTQYTGDAMLGIGVLHKSNSVPIFKQEDAIDISKMRRG